MPKSESRKIFAKAKKIKQNKTLKIVTRADVRGHEGNPIRAVVATRDKLDRRIHLLQLPDSYSSQAYSIPLHTQKQESLCSH